MNKPEKFWGNSATDQQRRDIAIFACASKPYFY